MINYSGQTCLILFILPAISFVGGSIKILLEKYKLGGSAQVLGASPTVCDSPDLYLLLLSNELFIHTNDAMMTDQVYISGLLNLYII